MSKFRGSITLSIFSLSTLSNYHYWQSPKTRYWRLVRPYQTGIPPARLLALIWAHNSDLFASYYSHSSLLAANSVLCCLQTASPQGIDAQASQGSVAPLAERNSETFSIMFAVHLGIFPAAFDILPDTDPDRPC